MPEVILIDDNSGRSERMSVPAPMPPSIDVAVRPDFRGRFVPETTPYHVTRVTFKRSHVLDVDFAGRQIYRPRPLDAFCMDMSVTPALIRDSRCFDAYVAQQFPPDADPQTVRVIRYAVRIHEHEDGVVADGLISIRAYGLAARIPSTVTR